MLGHGQSAAAHLRHKTHRVGGHLRYLARASKNSRDSEQLLNMAGPDVAPGVHGDAAGDLALVTFRVHACLCQGNLRWRPVRQQEMMNYPEQTGFSMESGLRSSALPSVLAELLGLKTGVATDISVADQFSADGAGRSVQHASHSADAVLLLLQTDHCDLVFRLKLAVVR